MATPPPRQTLGELNIDPPPEPSVGDAAVDDQGNTEVTVSNADPDETYTAWIVDDPSGVGGNVTGSGPLTQVTGGSTTFANRIAVGSFSATSPGVPNRFVWVQEGSGGSQGHPFRAVSGSGSHGVLAASRTARGATARATQPVPVAVQLWPGPAPADGAEDGLSPLEQTTLIFSGLVGGGGAWLSAPIPVAPGQEPAYWQFHKCDARRWELLLRQRDVALVAYGHATAAEDDFAFPVCLELESPARQAYPRKIVVAAAP